MATQQDLAKQLAAAVGQQPTELFTASAYLTRKGDAVKPIVNILGAYNGITPANLLKILEKPEDALKAALAAIALAKSPETLKRLTEDRAAKAAAKGKGAAAAPAPVAAAHSANLSAMLAELQAAAPAAG